MKPEPRQAAVLVLLEPGEEGFDVVLTQRTEHLPTHAGQVAFPGGRFDPELDESLLATALREAEEEIGLRPGDVEVLGALPPVATRSSRFEIWPFVARLPARYEFTPHAGEVGEVFRMPLRAYTDPGLRVAHPWSVEGQRVDVPGILFDGRLVWGATLRILDLLAESGLLED
jgi:8-oxo-dGTP pyrophosphatase MutT (NUDIX family)